MTDTSSPDAYATLTGLVALLADGKATVKRLDELRKLEERIAAAQAKLDADRVAHEQKVAADKAELGAREAKVAERLYKAMRLEKEPPADRDESDRPDPFPFDPNLLPGTRGHTGLARDRGNE